MKWGKMGGKVDGKLFVTVVLTTMLVFGFGYNLVNNGDVEDQSLDISDEINSLDDLKDLKATTLDQLPEEVQSNVRQTLEKFQGGFMRSPDSPYYFLKSSSLTMIFKESEILVRIPQYEQKNSEREGVENAAKDIGHQSPSIIGMTEVVLHFPGSNLVEASTAMPQTARYNYFKGEESQWIRNSPYYQKLMYRNLYDNIDLVYDMSHGNLKYEFLVHPGGDYHQIELEWLGDLYISQLEEGLVFSVNTSEGVFPITDNNPVNFIGLERIEEISGEFTIVDENSYGFSIVEYDSSEELIIDPAMRLGFSTLLGGSDFDRGEAIALDDSRNVYITGYTQDTTNDFPTTPGAYNETHWGSYDVFVTKLSSDGSTLLFSTLIGGSGSDFGRAIALDISNNIYITGVASDFLTFDFPTTPGAYNETHNGGFDVFVTKLSSDGSILLFSTFIGGSNEDDGYGIALDSFNNVYIAGSTSSIDFPTTTGAYNETHNGGFKDVFVTKLSSDGSILEFSTLLGGSGSDYGYAIALDAFNNVYITGETWDDSTDFPTTPGSYDESHNGVRDVFVTKLSSDGSTLLFSTLMGGSDWDFGYAIALDSSNNVYITGFTWDDTIDFPTTPGAYNEIHNGGDDVFVTKLSSDGSTLLFSTLIGGPTNDRSYAITLDNSNNVYVTGVTECCFPTTAGAYNETVIGGGDVFITKLSSDGSSLLLSTLIGGSSSDIGRAITLDAYNNVYVIGETWDDSTDFPTTPGSYNESHNGANDVFVTRINVEEFNPPEVSGSYGLTYDFESVGNQINWNIGDTNPGSFNITLDGALVNTQVIWSNGIISWNVDGLALGIYNYTIHVFDYWGNLNEHSVIVTVTYLNLKNDLWFSTLMGESSSETGYAITLDPYNNVYVTGTTLDSFNDFPTTQGAYKETHNGSWDVFVTKLSSDGSTLMFSTLIGGSKQDFGYAIALDSSNNVYVTGTTYEDTIDFPTTPGAYNETHSGGSDVFVTKLSSDGSSLLFSTLLGGTGSDFGYAIVLDAFNNVYITGETYDDTTDFPTTPGVYNETHNGVRDVFVTKLSSDGSTLLFSTLLGGSGNDFGRAIALDSFNNIYITGETWDATTDFPITLGAFNESHNGGLDVFVTKLSSDGSTLLFSTLIGGSSNDIGRAIALDIYNNVYVIGNTEDSTIDFPTTPGAYDETHNGRSDVFVTKLSSNGSNLVFSTLIGGSDWDYGYAIALDSSNNVYVTGITDFNFPTTPGAYDESYNGLTDAFVTKLLSDGSNLLFSTLIGGSNNDYIYGIALDTSDNIYITGYSEDSNTDFPTTAGTYDETHNGGSDVFISKIRLEEFTPPEITSTGNITYEFGSTGHQINWIAGDKNPDSINITLDGILVETQSSWSNGTITWDIEDGLPLGEYNYTIYLSDYWGNILKDPVIITIKDTTSPEIILPDNINIEYKTNANQLSWTIGDLLPDVYNITLDGEIYKSTTAWTNGTIISNIDNLTLGQHNFTIYVYDISGNVISSSVIVTVEDTVNPIVSSLENVTYEFGSADNTINWIPSDHDPLMYQILLNGSEIETGTWNSSQSIALDVNKLYIGVHNFTIVVTDGSGNKAADTILVEVLDTVNPEVIDTSIIIDNSLDLTYELGSTGNSLSWIASDLDPDNYQILVNGTIIKSYEWTTSEPIGTSIDGYEIGFYNLTIILFDKSGNSIFETVIIKVIDTQNPIFDLPANIELNQEIIAGETMIILIEDAGVVTKIEYRWNDGELMTVFPINTATLRLNQVLEKYYFNIPVPEELVDTEATLQITAFDESGNSDIFFFDVNVISPDGDAGGETSGLPPEVLIGILVASVLAVSTATFRFRQRHKMDKAFDDLQSDFEGSEISGEGKND